MFPRSEMRFADIFPETVESEWVRYPSIYTSACNDSGVLEIDLVADYPAPPFTPQELQAGIAAGGGGNRLHWAEPFITNADLVRIVEMHSANR